MVSNKPRLNETIHSILKPSRSMQVRPKQKVVLLPEIGRMKMCMCIRIYILNLKKTKPKIARRQKAKETKEEKRVSVWKT